MSASDVPISELAPASKPKPGRKSKKQRAPRVVKKREYQIYRDHGTCSVEKVIPSGPEATAHMLEKIGAPFPDKKAAIDHIDAMNLPVSQRITFRIMATIASVTVEMKPTLTVE